MKDFRAIVADTIPGDFVYFDPPYVPLSETSDFTSYAPGGFSLEDHRLLAQVFAELSRKGVYAMLSNSDTTTVRELYEGFRIDDVSATRSVNANATGRGKVGEVVVRNYVSARTSEAARRPRRKSGLSV